MIPLSNVEISEDGGPIAVVEGNKTPRDHGIRGLEKNIEASSSHCSFIVLGEEDKSSSYSSKGSSRVSQATVWPSIVMLNPEKG